MTLPNLILLISITYSISLHLQDVCIKKATLANARMAFERIIVKLTF